MLADQAKYRRALQPLNGILNARNPTEAHAFRGQLPPRLAIDWGFPPGNIGVVQQLKSAGFRIFWFDGDRARARQEFITRVTVPVSALDIQMPQIEATWAQIQALFSPNEINVLSADGSRMTEAEIWKVVGRGVA